MTDLTSGGSDVPHDPNWLDLQDMVNVRDVGGLPTRDGRRTRHGVVLRGETPDEMSAADVAHLVDVVGLRLVVDLRMASERDGRRSPLTDAGVEVLHLPMFDNPMTSAKLREAVPHDEGAAVMAEFYLSVLQGFGERAKQLMTVLVDNGGPVLVHCAAGKDRTGMVVALLLGAADVTAQSIAADYAATEHRLERLFHRLSRVIGDSPSGVELPAHVRRADPATMSMVVDSLVDTHGDLRTWWRDAGCDEATLDAWCHRFVI
jgi:protein-tyrosine phosphatase